MQLHAGFDFHSAARIAPYLARLGVSHLYCSPYLQARQGSLHGYDVVDPARVNPELGGDAGRVRLVAALAESGLGQVLDIVPNHMAADAAQNPWWHDVLANGRESAFAHYFDIDWAAGGGRVVLPVLGREVGEVIEAGELIVDAAGSRPVIRYFDHVFPVADGTLNVADVHQVLAAQHYELAFWRTGLARINYRRFFDVSDLAGLRVEAEDVFAASHELITGWLRDGSLAGLRVDHPDGLRDPEQYFKRLRQLAPRAWIVVEKILEPGEELRSTWPVDGTTGYDFLNRVLGLFIDPAAEVPLSDFYMDFTGQDAPYDAVARTSKEDVLAASFHSDLQRLARLFVQVAAEAGARVGELDARKAISSLIVDFPVYRSYVRPEAGVVAGEDASCVEKAMRRARDDQAELAGAFELLEDVLLLRRRTASSPEFIARLQQTTGPVMAKGVEDTAFYRFNRLVALNEVGGDPARFGSSVAEFHATNVKQAAKWPGSMLATSTHDTKRSEDVRARLAVLTEVAAEWMKAVRDWSAHNAQHKTGGLPDCDMEYTLYQAFVGAFPLSSERAEAYALKAAREAKRHTSWLDPDNDYEEALREFVARCLADRSFSARLQDFVERVVDAGRANSLAQKLITLTAPGVPDIYQGSELWDLSLVDPDNRRPVDFAGRERLLAEEARLEPGDVLARADEGLPKLRVVVRALRVRRRLPHVFERGSYTALQVTGAHSDHIVAFMRGDAAVTVVPRLGLAVRGDWRETSVELLPQPWTNEFTGEVLKGGPVRIADLFRRYPVALLTRA